MGVSPKKESVIGNVFWAIIFFWGVPPRCSNNSLFRPREREDITGRSCAPLVWLSKPLLPGVPSPAGRTKIIQIHGPIDQTTIRQGQPKKHVS